MKTISVLITGAAQGIGYAAARRLGESGAKVFLASRQRERGQAAVNQLRDEGHDIHFVALDITVPSSVEAAVTEVCLATPQLDVLVNNAAVLLDADVDIFGLTADVLLRTLDTNVAGALRVTQGFLPWLRKSTSPRIVNVSSGSGQLEGAPQMWAPAYSISKTALNMLTQQLAGALPEFAVNAFCPGWCRTDLGGNEAPRSPAEGADTLVWLATEAPQSQTGQFFRDRQALPW